MKVRRTVIGIAVGAVGALLASAAQADTLYVDDDAAPNGDGQTWATCCRYLQDALALAAASGGTVTEIHVAQGTYTPDRNELNPEGAGECFSASGTPGCPDAGCQTAVCDVLPMCCFVAWDQNCADFAEDLCGAWTFQLPNGVALLGGYAGQGAPEPDERDIESYETVLSGDLLGDDGPDFANYGENTWHVVTGSGTDQTTQLDGFTVTAGYAGGPLYPASFDAIGAGMFNDGGSPTVSACTFAWNRAMDAGAGMANLTDSSTIVSGCLFDHNWVDEDSPQAGGGGGMINALGGEAQILDCVFSDNVAQFGGGVHNYLVDAVVVTGCTFENNTARDDSAGILVYSCTNVSITSCVFSGNTALGTAIPWGGGGGYIFDSSSATVVDCTFEGNSSGWGAGLACQDSTDVTVAACTFDGNTSFGSGGGLAVQAAAPTIADCLIVGNEAAVKGGGMHTWLGGHPTVINCTVGNNTAPDGAGLYNHDTNGTEVRNCILWGNVGAEIDGETAIVSYSYVQGGYGGTGNIDTDPLFVDPDNGDFRLSPGSPCIDAADNTAVPPGHDTDLDGNPRFVDDPCKADTGLGVPPIVDMGAYEFQCTSCDVNFDGDVGVNDFLQLLADWGPCGDCSDCPSDFDGDCSVGVTDFLILLSAWGPCP